MKMILGFKTKTACANLIYKSVLFLFIMTTNICCILRNMMLRYYIYENSFVNRVTGRNTT